MVSARYQTLAALLDDPLNRAIVERELARRSRPLDKGLLPPPLPREGGGKVFVTMREYQRRPVNKVPASEVSTLDYMADVFESTEGWFVTFQDESEVGPLPTCSAAVQTACAFLTREGWEVLKECPWTPEEAEAYPFTNTLI